MRNNLPDSLVRPEHVALAESVNWRGRLRFQHRAASWTQGGRARRTMIETVLTLFSAASPPDPG